MNWILWSSVGYVVSSYFLYSFWLGLSGTAKSFSELGPKHQSNPMPAIGLAFAPLSLPILTVYYIAFASLFKLPAAGGWTRDFLSDKFGRTPKLSHEQWIRKMASDVEQAKLDVYKQTGIEA